MIVRKVKVGVIGRILLGLSVLFSELSIGIWNFMIERYAPSVFYSYTNYDPCTKELVFSKMEES